ncbi:hypothetical protein JOF53_002657 [Crossiella equi]|uniref:Uncharacterized protein n=1 Tax=Crossiella equi TaxID=130796 RepID=A0ABS5ADK9_9PSEU|nr:hypothetical protein [Crossiella equi]MBP2473785.1 hypothetical protein [Crossiella equi]
MFGRKSAAGRVAERVHGAQQARTWLDSTVSYRDKTASEARLRAAAGTRYWELLGAGPEESRVITPVLCHQLALCERGWRDPGGDWRAQIQAILTSHTVYDTDVQKCLYDLRHAHVLSQAVRSGTVPLTEAAAEQIGRLRAGELLAVVKVVANFRRRRLSAGQLAGYEPAVRLAQLDGDLAEAGTATDDTGRFNLLRAYTALTGSEHQAGTRLREIRHDLLTAATRAQRELGEPGLKAWLARRASV